MRSQSTPQALSPSSRVSSTFHCTIVGDDEDDEEDGDDNSIEEDKAFLTINFLGIISIFNLSLYDSTLREAPFEVCCFQMGLRPCLDDLEHCFSSSKWAISCFRGFRTLVRMVFALFCSFGNNKKKMTKIVFEKVLQAPSCTFDRRGEGLKLFGQCPYGNNTFQKGASLRERTKVPNLTCSPAASFVPTFELETPSFFGPASVCHSDSFT